MAGPCIERRDTSQRIDDRVGLVIELFHGLFASVTLLDVRGNFLQ